jgi:hypothetical protein
MGLLDIASGQPDVDRATGVARTVCGLWNARCSGSWGFVLKAHLPEIKAICLRGAELFGTAECFPREPGPFKRAAAFLVLSRLSPFYSVNNGVGVGFTAQERHHWNTRFLVLSVGPVLRQTHLMLDGHSRHVMASWKGFPSLHYLLEFLVWLRWLDDFQRFEPLFQAEWRAVSMQRLARMVMSTSLIIEACYYGAKSPFPSSCLDKLSEEQRKDIMYDYELGYPR